LISEYLNQSIIPDPAFIALQDESSNVDIEAIQNVLQQRRRSDGATYKCVAWDCKEDTEKEVVPAGKKEVVPAGKKKVVPAGKKAALLYNENVLVYDEESILAKDDFFHRRYTKAELLFNRLDGGLFLHKPSKRFIVAVSYHGKNACPVDEKKEFISGMARLSSG
jgi:hypothetical protein